MSIYNDSLENSFAKEICTPTIKVTGTNPPNQAAHWSIDPLVVIIFDQKVNAEKTLKNVKCYVAGAKKVYSTGISNVSLS